MKKEESINLEFFSKLSKNNISNIHKNRPKDSLIEIIDWTKQFVGKDLKCIIHNNIYMNGEFKLYSQENNLLLETIHCDAITTWKEDDIETFLSIGIYKVSKGNNYFYACSLMHKGTDWEDEISFFVLLDDKNFDFYINMKNDYLKWTNDKNRVSCEVEVIGSDPIPYSTDLTWDDLFLPDDLKEQIKTSVEGFLKSKDLYSRLNVPWKRGLIFWGERGIGKTSCIKVIMSMYRDLKPVTIQTGSPNMTEVLKEAFYFAEEHSPSLLYFEDLQELIQTIDISNFLQLLDGVRAHNGILIIATGNNISNLEKNITSRPRRFDKKFEFPMPDKDMSKKYLKKFFNDILSEDQVESLVKYTMNKKFTYAHLQELYFSSVFYAISNGRETPTFADAQKALKEVIEDRKYLTMTLPM